MSLPSWRWRDSLPLAFAWRYLCHAAMLALDLANEAGPAAPSIPDALLARVPHVAWVATNNYWIWLACYVPVGLLLWWRDRAAFVRFLWLGGWLSLLRGVCIPLTRLGPVVGPDLNAGLPPAELWRAWLTLVDPLAALAGNAPQIYLTKDLFFSGHVATTFLLWLACRGHGRLARLALAGHVATVGVVFLSHLHYTIDVVGAWAVTYSLWIIAERRRGRAESGEPRSAVDVGAGFPAAPARRAASSPEQAEPGPDAQPWR